MTRMHPQERLRVGTEPPRAIERHRPEVLAAAGVAPLVVSAALSVCRDRMTSATMVLLVIFAASTGLRAAGFIAAVSTGVWFDFFLTQPYRQLAINDPDVIANRRGPTAGPGTSTASWGQLRS